MLVEKKLVVDAFHLCIEEDRLGRQGAEQPGQRRDERKTTHSIFYIFQKNHRWDATGALNKSRQMNRSARSAARGNRCCEPVESTTTSGPDTEVIKEVCLPKLVVKFQLNFLSVYKFMFKEAWMPCEPNEKALSR